MAEDFSRLRQEAGLSKQEAADRTGYSLRTIYRWENGVTAPRRAAVECLAAIVRRKRLSAGAFTFIDLFAGIGGMRRGFRGRRWPLRVHVGVEPVLAGDLPRQLRLRPRHRRRH